MIISCCDREISTNNNKDSSLMAFIIMSCSEGNGLWHFRLVAYLYLMFKCGGKSNLIKAKTAAIIIDK